ncbi:uncharacterized protein VTP21DRAFT_9786 [Calcarisporiella thermophila]|uniref:uncharacterized protein n=1 Tax=Calcarisporiella thermophila TaxID=911321 RepID=UPI0037446BCA
MPSPVDDQVLASAPAAAEQAASEQSPAQNGEAASQEPVAVEPQFQLTIKLPRNSGKIQVIVSPHEIIHEVRQLVMESPEAFMYSCFYLAFEGKRLNDFIELGDVEGLTPESELDLIEDLYTEREARIHVNRLRDVLSGPVKNTPSSLGVHSGVSFLGTITSAAADDATEEKPPSEGKPGKPTAFADYQFDAAPSLSRFVPEGFEHRPVTCLRSLAVSGWNPPPHPRRLRGDLMYLSVVTLEGENLQITSSAHGFFVNRSSRTQFDPNPRKPTPPTHSLITLLQEISPQFASQFRKLQDMIGRSQIHEALPIPYPANSWLVKSWPHTYDAGRPAEAYLVFGVESADSLRDWNDELQTHRELPRNTLQERVLRDRMLHKVHADFGEAAVKGSLGVVHGEIIPLNPLEPRPCHMYVHNSIFYSKAMDARGIYESLGGDEAAHVAAGKDLAGVRGINQADVPGLCTLGQVIVDYKGERIVAQSIVPGIFRQQEESTVVYGSVEGGDVVSDPAFHELVGKVARQLRLAEHAVGDVRLYTSHDVKGLLGADGRKYLLDLCRMCPVDIEFLEEVDNKAKGENGDAKEDGNEGDKKEKIPYPHRLTFLRPELLELFWEHRLRAWVKEKALAKQKEAKAESEDQSNQGEKEAPQEKPEDSASEQQPGDGKEEKEQAEGREAEGDDKANDVEEIDTSEFDLSFNPDAFLPYAHKESSHDEETRQQEEVVRQASRFLRETIIPGIIVDFASHVVSPLDGSQLTRTLHRRGINIRYLGRIASLAESVKEHRLDYIVELLVHEMIIRACKRIIRKLLRDVPTTETAHCVAHFFNCLVGTGYNPTPAPPTASSFDYAQLTPAALQEEIRFEVQRRFRYSLPADFMARVRKVPLLREVCLRVGVQLEARDYCFEPVQHESDEDAAPVAPESGRNGHKKGKKAPAEKKTKRPRVTTFLPEDVVALVPVVKDSSPRSQFAEESFETGRLALAQGQRQLGVELLHESLALHEQCYGFVHPETARCYGSLAMIYYQSEERELALELQRKSVVVLERTCGVDAPETIHAYLNLSLFEHAAGRTRLALRYLRHAMKYWEIVYGSGHPDSATADNNVAVMLQHLREFTLSCRFFERACAVQESIFGKDHVLTASGNHLLAKSYALTGDFKKALAVEKQAYNIFKERLGDEDPRTRESEIWLKELTTNAVYAAKMALDQQKQAETRLHASPNAGAVGRKVSPSGAVKDGYGAKGNLPIDELLAYIGEGSSSSAGGKKKKSTASKSKKKSQRK